MLYEVITAKNAMNMALEINPDLIMIDINMQDISGFDVVKYMRDDDLTKKIPIIFLSASEPDFETEKAIAVGANGFLPKPLTIRDLETVITSYSIHYKKLYDKFIQVEMINPVKTIWEKPNSNNTSRT